MTTALQWRGVTLQKRGRTILDGIDLAIGSGEILAVIGPNGAGKTALLRTAVGLERPLRGTVLLNGMPLAEFSPGQRARRAAFLPQQAEAAWPIRVDEAVALGRLPYGRKLSAADRRLVAAAIADVGMEGFEARPLTSLSGGERALVLLARVLAVDAGVLLLDEPNAALDPHRQLGVMRLFSRLADQGKAVCVVLHDLALAARWCDRIALLDGGRMVAEGPAASLLTDELLERIYAVKGVRHQVDGASLLVSWEGLHPPGDDQ